MTDSCGGTYRYIANVGPDDRIEDKLRRIADEIAATRRQRVRPAYKVKSLMPDHCKNAAPHAEATEGRR
jgi:ABC-type cobalamin transport system ATPase subunit